MSVEEEKGSGRVKKGGGRDNVVPPAGWVYIICLR